MLFALAEAERSTKSVAVRPPRFPGCQEPIPDIQAYKSGNVLLGSLPRSPVGAAHKTADKRSHAERGNERKKVLGCGP
jgi:hypothetical protein